MNGGEDLFNSETLRKTGANFVTPTNSNYEDDSESLSNYCKSDLYTSASLRRRNLLVHSTHHSAKLETLYRSHNSIKS